MRRTDNCLFCIQVSRCFHKTTRKVTVPVAISFGRIAAKHPNWARLTENSFRCCGVVSCPVHAPRRCASPGRALLEHRQGTSCRRRTVPLSSRLSYVTVTQFTGYWLLSLTVEEMLMAKDFTNTQILCKVEGK